MLRFASSSWMGSLTLQSQGHPPSPSSAAHFFVQRFEFYTTNPSEAHFSPEGGLRFDSGPQPAPPSDRREHLRRHHELLLNQPEMFAPPLWHVQTRRVMPALLLVDLYVDMPELRRRVQDGTPVTGRRLIIETVRNFRACSRMLDGLDHGDNYIMWGLWPTMEPAYRVDDLRLQSVHDVRTRSAALGSAADLEATAELEAVLRTPPYASQLRVIGRMLHLEDGTKYKPIPRGTIRFAAGGHDMMINEHERFVAVNPATEVCVRGGYLCNAMGSGKSYCVLGVCEAALRCRPPPPPTLHETRGTLIVCPAQVVQHWLDEIRKHVRREASTVVLVVRRDLAPRPASCPSRTT